MISAPLSDLSPAAGREETTMTQPATNFGFTEADRADESRVLSYIAAISEALREEMRRSWSHVPGWLLAAI